MEINFNKSFKKFNKRKLSFEENALNVIYAENGIGKSKLSEWIYYDAIKAPLEYFDEKQDKKIDISKNIKIIYKDTNEIKSVFLKESFLKIPVGKMHYRNTPDKSLLGDYLLMKSFFNIPGSFTNFANNIFIKAQFPRKFILPKIFKPIKTESSFTTLRTLHDNLLKIIDLFEKNKITTLPHHRLKYTHQIKKSNKIVERWEYATSKSGIKIIGNLKKESVLLIKTILEISRDQKIVEFLNDISNDYLLFFEKIKSIGKSFCSLLEIKKLLNIVRSTILELNIKRYGLHKRKTVSLKSNWNFEKIKKYYPKGKITSWEKHIHSFLVYSLIKDKTNKSLVLKMIDFYNSNDFTEMKKTVKKMSIYQLWIVVFKRLGIDFETATIDFRVNWKGIEMDLIDNRFQYLSKGQKDILNIQLRTASIEDTFQEDKHNILIIDDYGETFDKMKYDIFIRKLEYIRSRYKVTILLFTHDYTILHLLKYMKNIRNKYFYTLTKTSLKNHKPIIFEKHSELIQILNNYKKGDLLNWSDFLFLLRVFTKHEIATLPNIKIGIQTKNIAELQDVTNNYYHNKFKEINQETHIGILNWVIDNLLIILNHAKSHNKILNNRKKIEYAFNDIKDIKNYKFHRKTYKSKFEVIDIFGNSLFTRIKLEKYFFDLLEKVPESKVSQIVKFILNNKKEYNYLYHFEYEFALLNQQIHIESTNSFFYSDELKTREFPTIRKILLGQIKIKP